MDHFLAVAAIVVTSILVLLCFTTGKRGHDGRDGGGDRKMAKTSFPLPALKEDGSGLRLADLQRLLDRLGLARTNGCVVTLALSGSGSGSGSSSSTTGISSGARVLAALASVANVFVVAKAQSPEEEERIWNELRSDPAVAQSSVARHRVLFHETAVGKVAVVRQLRPQLHIDFDADICGSVAPHIKTVVEYKGFGPRAAGASGDAALLSPCVDKRGNTWGVVAHLEDVLSVTVSPLSKARQ